MKRLQLIAVAAAAGAGLGTLQVVRENQATWDAVHATLPTVLVQTAAGALIGGAFVGAVMYYLTARRGQPVRRNSGAPRIVPVDAGMSRPDYSIRHVFVFLFGAGLLAAGGLVVLACLRHPTVYGILRGGAGAVFLMGLGAYLLWEDFVAPHVTRR